MSTAPDKNPNSPPNRSFWSGCRSFAIHLILITILVTLSFWLVVEMTIIQDIVAKQGSELNTGLQKMARENAETKAVTSLCETSVQEMARLTRVMQQEHVAVTKQLEASAQKMIEQGLDMKEVLQGKTNDLGPSKRIAEALAAAEDSEKRGDLKLAATFLVNALQRDPANLDVAKRYVDTAIKAGDADMLAGAQGLLGQLLFQIRPADVPAVAGLLKQVAEASPKERGPAPSEPLSQRIEATLAAKPELDEGSLTVWLENLLFLQEELAETDPPAGDMQKKLAGEIELAQACLKAIQIQKEIEVRLKNVAEASRLLEKTADERNQTYALASLQAAELAVNAIWTIDHTLLPADLARKVQAIPDDLKKLAANVQDKAEALRVTEAKQIWSSSGWRNYTLLASQLKESGKALVACNDLASKIQGDKAKKEFRDLLLEITDEMEAVRKKQFAAYQKWAVDEAEKSRYWFFENWVKVEHHVDSALKESDMQKIDLQLLSPETAQFVQDVLASMLAECGPKKKAEVQRNFTIGAPNSVLKKRLEDF